MDEDWDIEDIVVGLEKAEREAAEGEARVGVQLYEWLEVEGRLRTLLADLERGHQQTRDSLERLRRMLIMARKHLRRERGW